MKKLLIALIFLIISQTYCFGETLTNDNVKIFTSDNKYYGLKDNNDNIIVENKYKKLIRLGKNGWIIQNKRNKYGLADSQGNILIKPEFSHAERYSKQFVKLGNSRDYGLYDEFGNAVIPPVYKAIMPLFGQKFLTYKHNKYGIYSATGEKLLDNVCDFIYMQNLSTITLKYNNEWITLTDDSENLNIKTFQNEINLSKNNPQKDTSLYVKTGVETGCSILTATDYTFKAFSSISNAYEDTIDELMFSQGIDTVSIFLQMSWIPKFPIVYVKNYINNITEPSNGKIEDMKSNLKEKLK